jgi:glycosyltransferase involved in cell wall biosynthesis
MRSTGPQQRWLHDRRVVVVGINYAPETTGIAPYTTELAELLAANGAQVTALVGLPHYPAWSVDPGYRRGQRADEVVNGVRVLRAGHFVPRRQSALRRGVYEGTFALASSRKARGLEADAVVAVTPSLSGLRTGRILAQRQGIPLGVVVQDLLGRAAEQSGIPGGGRVARVVDRTEREALRAADRVAVISPAFREALVGGGVDAAAIRVLPNHSQIEPATVTRTQARLELGWDPDELVVLHTGNMGLKQDLGGVVEAARLCATTPGAERLRFVLVGDGSQRAELERAARGVAALRMLPPVDAARYPLTLAAADVLLLHERPTVRDMSLPSKLTSYLVAGRPVVAAVVPGGATDRETARAGAGPRVPAGDPAALLHAVLGLAGDDARRARLGAMGRAYAERELSREAAQRRTLAFVADLLGLPTSAEPRPATVPAPAGPARRDARAAQPQDLSPSSTPAR